MSRLMLAAAFVAVAVVSATVTVAATAAGAPGSTNHSRAVPHTPPTFQPDNESKFVPIAGCRIVDTRKIGGPFTDGAQRVYYVTGTTGFQAQGGHAGGCGIPAGATAVAATFQALNSNHNGSVRAWPNGLTEPLAVVLAYPTVTAVSSGGTVGISGAEPSLKVRNHTARVSLTIDVTGYYMKPLAGFISPSGSPYSGSSRILGATRTAVGTYEVQFDRNIRYCSAVANAYVSSYYASVSTWFDSTRPDTLRVNLWDANGNAVDQYVYVQVLC